MSVFSGRRPSSIRRRIPRREGVLTAALIAGAFALVVGGAYLLVHDTQHTSVAAVGVVAAFIGFRWPRLLLVAAIPMAIIADPLSNDRVQVLLPLALGAVWVSGLITGRWTLDPVGHGLLAAFGLWMVGDFIAVPNHLETALSPAHDLQDLFLGLIVCGAAMSIRPPVRWVLMSLAVTGLGVAWFVLQSSTLVPAGGTDRIVALGLNSNYLGEALALSAIAAVMLYRLPWGNPVWPVLAVVATLGIRVTQSRGSLIALGAAILAAIVLSTRRRAIAAVVIVAVLVLALEPALLDSIQAAVLGHRTTADLALSTRVRTGAAQLAVSYALANPIGGVGYLQFAPLAARDPHFALYIATHDDYLRLAAETGLVSLALFLGLVLLGLMRAGRVTAARPVMVAFLVGLLFTNALSVPSVATPFWMLLGLCIGVGRTGPGPAAARSASGRRETAAPI